MLKKLQPSLNNNKILLVLCIVLEKLRKYYKKDENG